MHSVNTITWDYGKNAKEIEQNKQLCNAECNDIAEHHSDGGGLDSNIKFYENKVFETIDEANDWLDEQTSKGFYWQGACLFKEYEKAENPKSKKLFAKADELDKKVADMRVAFSGYLLDNKMSNRKSVYVGCSKCGSKLHKDYLEIRHSSSPCPCCGNDLFSDTVKNRIIKYKKDISELDKQATKTRKEAETSKCVKGKFKLKWLVRYEYHC